MCDDQIMHIFNSIFLIFDMCCDMRLNLLLQGREIMAMNGEWKCSLSQTLYSFCQYIEGISGTVGFEFVVVVVCVVDVVLRFVNAMTLWSLCLSCCSCYYCVFFDLCLRSFRRSCVCNIVLLSRCVCCFQTV